MELMMQSIAMIQQSAGVMDANLGKNSNDQSGKAIIALQDQGALATAPLFDNLRLARQLHGEKMLSIIEQFMTEEKQFRITNKRGNPSFVTVNDGLPQNDITRSKADFIISEQDANSTLRQSSALALNELVIQLAGPAPEIAVKLLDLLAESMDLPNGEEIVKRIRQITGMEDPEADPDQPDPERDARQAAEAEASAYAKEMAMAELAKLKAEVAEKEAKVSKMGPEIEKMIALLPGDSVDVKTKALALAMEMLNAASSVPMIDAVLSESGYVSPQMIQAAKAEQEAAMAQEAAMQEQAAMQAQPQPQPPTAEGF
jgi:hypothetical protein